MFCVYNNRCMNRIASGIFFVIAVVHLLRLIFRWDAVIAGWPVPMWASGVAIVLFGALAYATWSVKDE